MDSNQHRRGLCLVLVGPSGSGKSTIMRELCSIARSGR